MVYFGEALSSTLVHVEPGILGSSNVALVGYKGWRFFPEPSMIKIEEMFKSWGVKCRKGCSSTKCRTCNCLRPSSHAPVYFASSQFLNEYNIPFFDVVQGPGDVIVINPGVGHSIVNLTYCVAEAKTLLPLNIMDIRNEAMCCQCPSGREFVPLRRPTLFWVPVTRLMCPYESCAFSSLGDRNAYNKHIISHLTFTCNYCGASVSTAKHLKRHIKNLHESEPSYCYPCQKPLKPSTLQNHPKSIGHRQAVRAYLSDRVPVFLQLADDFDSRKLLGE